LNVAILIRDVFDMAAALRDAKLSRAILEQALTYLGAVGEAEVRTPYATLLIWPASAIGAGPPNENDIKGFFALERILALFLTLP
jgi:hypothetical protein